MKKLILSLLFVLIASFVKAQYKPLSFFQNDTTAFIIYNFMERAEEYKGKTIKDLITDLKMPIAYFHCGYDMYHFYTISLYVYPRAKVYALEEAGEDANSILITWKNKIPVELYDRFGAKWNTLYDCLKDIEIKDVRVIIGKNSKYYSKYKKKEPRRAHSRFREVKDENDSTFVRFDIDEILKLKSNDKK